MAHFCCSNCKERINGEHYVILESQLICLNCSERNADYCDTCGERIEADQPQKAHESQHWHATDACFYCYTCLIPLNNRGFFSHYGELFCSNKCISQINDPSINTRSRT
jgi:prickle